MSFASVVAIELFLIWLTQCQVPIESDFSQLSSILECGEVITPTHNTFDEYAINNFSTWDDINIPDAIVMCHCENDVAITMKWISSFPDRVNFRIRSGGNSFGGYSKSKNSIIIDLSQMKNIAVLDNTKPQKITVEPGTNLYDFENWKASNIQFTSTLPHGLCPYVAIGGYATGGGIGLQSKKWGALCDYIYGVRVVLCDGSLWEIIDLDESVEIQQTITYNCLFHCDNPILDEQNAKDLLYAIKGGGGGNFGIITKYYFNAVNDPEQTYFFSLNFPLKTRDNIVNSHKAFKNIFDDFPSHKHEFSIALITSPHDGILPIDFAPHYFSIRFLCIYLPTTDDKSESDSIFYEIINKLEEHMQTSYVYSASIIETDISLTDIYRLHIFPQTYPDIGIIRDYTLHGYPSTRLIYEHDYTDENIDVLAEYIYENTIKTPPIEHVLRLINPSFFIESLGGQLSINNEKTSFPLQNRNALAVYEIFHTVALPILTNSKVLTAETKRKRDDVDANVMSVFGDDKYVNYLDDVDNDLTHYYSQDEINRLSQIKRNIDPDECFTFELGINNSN